MNTRPDAAEDQTTINPARLRTILIAMCVALMAVTSSASGLNVAQSDLAVEFGASQSTVLWIINIYTLSVAALVLPLGALSDRIGRKQLLVAGLIVFFLGSLMSGLAPTSGVMLLARFLSGTGAAMIMPITLAVITSTFPEDKRGQAIGVWTAVAGGGGMVGMFVSAALVDLATWRWLFVLPLILAAVAAFMTVRSVPNTRERPIQEFDAVGALASLVAVTALIYALQEGPARGWTNNVTLVALSVGVLSTVGFISWELRLRDRALLNVRYFLGRRLTSGSVTLLVVFGVQAGSMVVLFPFLQAVMGWSGLIATLAMLPMMITMMLASGLAPKVMKALSARKSMALGVLLAGSGLVLMATTVSVSGGYLSILPGLLVMGLGMGLSMTPSTEAITGSLSTAKQGVASALNDVTRALGTALGVALLGALMNVGYRNAIDGRLQGVPESAAQAARAGVATGVEAAHRADAGAYSEQLLHAAQQSFVDGWQTSMFVSAGVMAVLFVFLILFGPGPQQKTIEPDAIAALSLR